MKNIYLTPGNVVKFFLTGLLPVYKILSVSFLGHEPEGWLYMACSFFCLSEFGKGRKTVIDFRTLDSFSFFSAIILKYKLMATFLSVEVRKYLVL